MSKLDGLYPRFRDVVEKVIASMQSDDLLKSQGVHGIIVVEGLRTLPVQMAYFSRGRMQVADVKAMFIAAGLWALTDKEAQTKVTWTLKSRHLEGKAVDIAPSRDGKTIWWDAPEAVWQRMGTIGMLNGLVWGGAWPGKRDLPHFEEPE